MSTDGASVLLQQAYDHQQASVHTFIEDFQRDWTAVMSADKYDDVKYDDVWRAYAADDEVLFIRPSGNPATKTTFQEMMGSGDIEFISSELTSIDSVRFFAGGEGCVATYSQHDKFR